MTRRHLAAVCAACVLYGCDGTPGEPDTTDLLVVEAYLFAGEPVDDIRLTGTVPLSDTVEAPPVNDAQVALLKNGIRYALVSSGDGYYRYAGADLAVLAGDTFRIEVARLETLVTAQTVVPESPVHVAVDGDTLWVPDFSTGFGRPPSFDQERSQLAVTWDNPDQLLHFVVVEGPEDSAETIMPEEFPQVFGRFRFLTEPTSSEYYFINMMALRYVGRHVVRVYRVNAEYAQLYENRMQDSRDLNEPPSNIVGGLGVFSAFNSDSAFFQVARDGG